MPKLLCSSNTLNTWVKQKDLLVAYFALRIHLFDSGFSEVEE